MFLVCPLWGGIIGVGVVLVGSFGHLCRGLGFLYMWFLLSLFINVACVLISFLLLFVVLLFMFVGYLLFVVHMAPSIGLKILLGLLVIYLLYVCVRLICSLFFLEACLQLLRLLQKLCKRKDMKEFMPGRILLIWFLSIIVYCNRDFIVCLVSLGSFGVLWLFRYFVYNALFCCGRFIFFDWLILLFIYF